MNLYSEINLRMSQFQQHLNNFENRLHDNRLPNQLSLLKIQEVASCLETLSKSAVSQKAHTLSELKAAIVVVKCDFEHKLVSSTEKLIELAQNGIIASDAYLKAQRLLSMAQSSLNSPQISEAFRQQLETIIINLNVLLGSQEIQEKSDGHARLSKVNDNSGILQLVLTHLNLTLKEIGPLSQVSKGFSTLCNNEDLWKKKCKADPYVELNNLQHQKTYKNLYKSETAYRKFRSNPNILSMILGSSIMNTRNIVLSNINLKPLTNLKIDKFRIKHLKKIIKQVVIHSIPGSQIKRTTPISDIQIIHLGKALENNQKVKDVKNWDEVPLVLLRNPSENAMEIVYPTSKRSCKLCKHY